MAVYVCEDDRGYFWLYKNYGTEYICGNYILWARQTLIFSP